MEVNFAYLRDGEIGLNSFLFVLDEKTNIIFGG